jgi:hypothetical protein
MRLFAAFLVFLLAQSAAAQEQQIPAVGIIDFYGLRTVKPEDVRAVLRLKEGDAVPKSKAEREVLERRLAALPNVARASVSFVCCDERAGKTILYVGILEKGQSFPQFRAAPKGKILLPAGIVDDGENFTEALIRAVQKGDAEDDALAGHSLMKNPEARAFQEKFILFAAGNFGLLRKVLRESSNAEHRALAAQIIAYVSDKRAIVADLVYAMRDSNESVRNNAMRALALIARFAQDNPQKKIEVPIAPFVDLLNSIEWSDRNKSAYALLALTENRDENVLALIRRNAFASLAEMVRWQNPGHALAPFLILGRTVDLTDAEIEKLWQNKLRVDPENKARKK